MCCASFVLGLLHISSVMHPLRHVASLSRNAVPLHVRDYTADQMIREVASSMSSTLEAFPNQQLRSNAGVHTSCQWLIAGMPHGRVTSTALQHVLRVPIEWYFHQVYTSLNMILMLGVL